MTEERPLWALLRSKGYEITREIDPELNPPKNRPVGHTTHNLLVKDKKSKSVFLLVNSQSRECNLKEAAAALGQKEFRMADRSVIGVADGCITALTLAEAPPGGAGTITCAIDEALLSVPMWLCCAGCDDALDHSQHNVVSIPVEGMLELLEASGTPMVSLQTGKPLNAKQIAAAPAEEEVVEEDSFHAKQLAEATSQIVKIEKNDKATAVYDFAHKVAYLKDDGPGLFDRLLKALTTNTVLTTVYLGCNALGDADAEKVANALKNNKTLQNLYLQYNGIGDAGAKALSDLLASGSALSSLYLYGNNITCDGAKSLAEAINQSRLIKLHLSQNYIKQEGGTALAQALHNNTTLQVLSLSMNPVADSTATEIATALRGENSQLSFVSMGGCRVTDEGANALANAIEASARCRLQTLDLSATPQITQQQRARLDEVATTRRMTIQVN